MTRKFACRNAILQILCLLPLLLLDGQGASADAVDFRWGSSFAMGTIEALIHNRDDASLNVYCPVGQIDQTPGMFFHSKRFNPDAGEDVQVQIVVDSESFLFGFKEGQFEAHTRLGKQEFRSMLRSLAMSKARQFRVEVPRYGIAETFSLLGARKVIGGGGGTMVDDCLK